MSEMLSKKINDLNELIKTHKELKAKTVDKRLTELNFYDRTSKLFEPITKAVEKQSENINENLDVLKKSINSSSIVPAIESSSAPAMESSSNPIVLAPPLEGIDNNCFFKGVSQTNEGAFFGVRGSAQLFVKKMVYKRNK